MKITLSRCHEDYTNQGNVEAFLTRADTGQTYTVHVYAMTQVRIVNRVHLVALSHNSCYIFIAGVLIHHVQAE